MTWSDLLLWGLFAALGLGIGAFYFCGLWWTVGRLAASPRPRLLLGVSYLVRVMAAMLGFWFAIRVGLVPFFWTLAGFFLMRVLLTRKLGTARGASGTLKENSPV